ncbi:hypothetical protein KBF61_00665 [Candidatus Saccharibacteria bacterium]|nr:hypothetical protein [Candidatus Saccharibacteria bacterium]
MSIEHDQKLSFDNERLAKSAVTTANFQHGSKNLKVYRCRQCSLWHIATDHEI